MNPNAVRRWLRSRKVAVLKGGWSRERAISLQTGAAIEASLKRLKLPVLSIDVQPTFLSSLIQSQPGFVFIALHGSFGEDGGVQACLDDLGLPYNGSGSAASALAMDKEFSKRIFVKHRIPTPSWVCVDKRTFQHRSQPILLKLKNELTKTPLFIKPADQGSAIGVSKVTSLSQLESSLRSCFRYSEKALVETCVEGRELTVGILGKEALPVIEIVPAHDFYDFHSKYAKGGSEHVVPAPLPAKIGKKVQTIAKKAFQALSCAGYGRVDLMMDRTENVFVLEVNTIPGMTNTSLLPDAARAANIGFDELVLRIVGTSLRERNLV